jgi:transcription elongation factor GreA
MPSKTKQEEPSKDLSLAEAAAQYFISLTPEERAKAQMEVTKFIRWYGETRLLSKLRPQEVETYTDHLTTHIAELTEKITPVKDFLSFSYKQGFTKTKLAPHIKIKKTSQRSSHGYRRQDQKSIALTPQGFAELEAELKSLISQRPALTEEIRKAASDKDFRENAPLHAAKETMGKIEGRIKELDATLKAATILSDGQESGQIALIGYTVILKDMSNGEMFTYRLVDIKEANPSAGKVSVKSPIGKAVVGHKVSEKVDVIAPAGILCFEIIDLKQS